jgi:poly(A) polymerase
MPPTATPPRKIDPAAWQRIAGLSALLDALDGLEGRTRFVGGFVRDTLLGLAVKDVDLATQLDPAAVMRRVSGAGFKAVPTGLAHGTVTAILPGGPIEVTTLRRDVATDGRHAVVAFTDAWQEDAARRDFTINALFGDVTGTIADFFGGLDDLAAGVVRFIGDPLTRIAEDHLRILRFFRFHARFGAGAPDEAALAACRARANDLMALSRERIADELLKLLALDDPAPTLRLMVDRGILAPVLPEIGSTDMLARLVARERAFAVAPDPLRRLAALLPADAATADGVAARLKLSNAARRRLNEAADRALAAPRSMAYRLDALGAADRLLLSDAPETAIGDGLTTLRDWVKPRLPISGGALIAKGLPRGPIVAATVQAIERRWIEEDFPDEARVRAIAEEEVAQALRART